MGWAMAPTTPFPTPLKKPGGLHLSHLPINVALLLVYNKLLVCTSVVTASGTQIFPLAMAFVHRRALNSRS